MEQAHSAPVPSLAYPTSRRLRVFAVNPTVAPRIDSVLRNQTTLSIPWEDLALGPVGEYVEVVDYDLPNQCFYHPVDLNHPLVLTEDGLTPSEASPQFHQQMAYAVAMKTIRTFETALGRPALWARRATRDGTDNPLSEKLVGRLRIYPHAIKEANAFYDPAKLAIMFGYFPAALAAPGARSADEVIFTCLSPDVVARTTVLALLHGTRHHLHEPTGPDGVAFQAAFADIVALFQGLAQPDVVRQHMAQAVRDPSGVSALGGLARKTASLLAGPAGLRDAIGTFDPGSGAWSPASADPKAFEMAYEPTVRAAIVVAAVFDAYAAIYKRRVTSLMRVATGGTGVLPPGPVHPALLDQMAEEAARTARHVLRMCVRAVDYCPPLDLAFGDFLRAVITADRELVANDDLDYRTLFVEAFRQRGVYPRQMRTLSVASLCWKRATDAIGPLDWVQKLSPQSTPGASRREIADHLNRDCQVVNDWLSRRKFTPLAQEELGLALGTEGPGGLYRMTNGKPRVEVRSVRPTWRVGPDGSCRTELVIEITQRRRGWFEIDQQSKVDRGSGGKAPPKSDFDFRGGCTLLVDAASRQVRYAIRKSVLDEERLDRQRAFRFNSEGAGA